MTSAATATPDSLTSATAPGLELIRTLQQRAVSMDIDVFMECKILRLLTDAEGVVSGAVGYWRPTGEMVVFSAKAVVLATGGAGKSWKYTSNSWECTGDGHAMALWAGADLIDMECVQFHPTGMVWPLSVRGLLVTEGVRGDGGVLRNSEGRRFMFEYVADMFRAETADTEEEADRWYDDHTAGRRPPELLPRDEVARAINTEVKAGRGSPHGGVFLDIATRRSAEYIRRRLPSMYHQFMELAGVDITTEPMEVGPTCHYFMGGVRVGRRHRGGHGARPLRGRRGGRWDARLEPPRRQLALGPVGVRAPGRHGGVGLSPRRGGTPVPDQRRGRPQRSPRRSRPSSAATARTPTSSTTTLQDTMQYLVGIIRTGHELEQALEQLDELRDRASRVTVAGGRAYNPGWNLATDLPAMLTVSRCVTLGARDRKESRGGHTREDYPERRSRVRQGQPGPAPDPRAAGWPGRSRSAPSPSR